MEAALVVEAAKTGAVVRAVVRAVAVKKEVALSRRSDNPAWWWLRPRPQSC